MELNKNIIVLICFIIIIYLFVRVSEMETLANTDDTNLDRRIELAVRKVYGEDVENFRSVAKLARELNYSFLLKKGNLSYIGDLHVTGNLSVDKNLEVAGVSDTKNCC